MSVEKLHKIEYVSPKEALDRGEFPKHRFDLIVGGEKIGAAEVDYFSKPLLLYQVTELYVDFEHKGKGYASKIMEQVERFLKKRKRPGVLVDAIMPGDPAEGMYARRGWKKVPGQIGLHVFNWPDGIPLKVLAGYALRYPDLLSRQGQGQKKMRLLEKSKDTD